MKPIQSNPATRAEVRPFRRGSDKEKLFLAAVRMIPRHYRSFDMGNVMEEEHCGTVCCFGGIVALLTGHDLRLPGDWFGIARTELGLGNSVAMALFFPAGWPYQFADQLRWLAPRTPEYAVVAVQRYMHFYETGE